MMDTGVVDMNNNSSTNSNLSSLYYDEPLYEPPVRIEVYIINQLTNNVNDIEEQIDSNIR
jgi:hypothetical protein